jgi:hypothetical protein
MNNTKNQSEFIPMPLFKLKERLQSEMNNFGLDKIMDEWKVKTLSDGWESKYDVIVINRIRTFSISISFGISPKHLSADVACFFDDNYQYIANSNNDKEVKANLKSIITNIDSYDSLYVKVDILDFNWLQTDYFKENVDENGLIKFCPLDKLLDEINAQSLL